MEPTYGQNYQIDGWESFGPITVTRDSSYGFSECLPVASLTDEIVSAILKAWPKIRGYPEREGKPAWTMYPTIMVSVSGGSDSDIMLDMIERIGHPLSDVKYVYFDTGMEYEATKQHIEFLQAKYGVVIESIKAKVPVPLGCKRYGLPFLSKKISQNIYRLQKHGFKWEDKPFEELYAEYPRCKSALRWWCNKWGENSKLNISRRKWLKEFMILNPPDFPISDKCCDGAKKSTAKFAEDKYKPNLVCTGVRKAEGGARSTCYTSCFSENFGKADSLRPIFWFKKADKSAYEKLFGVEHSACYTLYGLDRVGCSCCPFGKYWEIELEAARMYEPKLHKAALNVFGKSYEYTRKYQAFKNEMEGHQ